MILFPSCFFYSFTAKERKKEVQERNRDLLTLESEEDYESLINLKPPFRR